MPEKPWSRLHLDHAVNFLGRNWLVLVDAYSKYPCIHPTTSTSSKSTTAILEQEFAHFGYPHTLVTDNATTFMSQEFQAWCKQRGIVHLTGAPYHPATNGAAERLIQSFKQALRKSSLPPKEALQEFLMQYRRIPFASGLSPSELLNGRRIRTKIDTLVPSIPHLLQKRQSRQASKHSNAEDSEVVSKVEHYYSLGDPCYVLYFGPRRDRDPKSMVHEASMYESFLEDQLGEDILINFDLDTVRIKMMIPVKSQRAFCLQKHFQPGLTTHLVLLR